MFIALIKVLPSPGIEKIFSTTKLPVKINAIIGPAYEITGVNEFLNVCLNKTFNGDTPLALAVLT